MTDLRGGSQSGQLPGQGAQATCVVSVHPVLTAPLLSRARVGAGNAELIRPAMVSFEVPGLVRDTETVRHRSAWQGCRLHHVSQRPRCRSCLIEKQELAGGPEIRGSVVADDRWELQQQAENLGYRTRAPQGQLCSSHCGIAWGPSAQDALAPSVPRNPAPCDPRGSPSHCPE